MFQIVHRLRPLILSAVRHHLEERNQQRLKPDTPSLVAGAAREVVRSKASLIAENTLLLRQLILLWRRARRPRLSNWSGLHHDYRLAA